MSFFNKKSFFILGLVLLGLVAVPVSLYVLQQKQETRSKADRTVVLSFEPGSTGSAPLQVPAGSTLSLDVFVDPGASSVSFVKAEILYDAAKFELAGGFIPNQEVFSQIVEGPSNTPGKVTTTLSIGSDLSKALKVKTKVGTVTLKALSTVPTNAVSSVSFGAESQALAVSSNASFNENVIANTIPASIRFNQPTLTCGTSATDTMLVIDKSGSMNDQAGTTGTKISNAKIAANNFIDILSKETRNTIGLATFSTTGQLNSPLTATYANVKTQVNAISVSGPTCIECGIIKANAEIAAKKRPGTKNVVVLLTDGIANQVEGNTQQVSQSVAEARALTAATNGFKANGTIFFTIGLGKDVNSTFLTKLATSTNGQYYYSPMTDQLNSIYNQISQVLAKGSISGAVFNDANSNGVMDATEQNLPGWTLQLTTASGQPQSISTDSTGTFTFPNLCDGSYTLKQVLQSGWKQTFPVAPADYAVTISAGNAATSKNFGNYRASRCSDGIDNDGNGFIDAKDSTCHTDGDPNNPGSYDPGKDGENGKNTCSDSKDNNGNGKIDGADPVCHTDGDPTKPYDPNLPEGTMSTTLSCTPTSVALDDAAKEFSVILKNANGTPLSGKTVAWSAQNDAVTLSPSTSQTDATGKASAGGLVSLTNKSPFTSTVTAKFAGDLGFSATTCTIQANYTPKIPTPTIVPTATPTPAPNLATLTLDILLHGIGSSGDNANPNLSSLSNKSPKTPARNTSVSIIDVNNNVVSSGSGLVIYNSTSGSFKGTVSTKSHVAAGKYLIKITSDYHLTRLVPGIQTVVEGQTNQIPAVHLVAGDANNDNRLDIRDYNLLLDCYSDLSPAPACTPQKKIATDGNDDGEANQIDYNLFLREISTQPGE